MVKKPDWPTSNIKLYGRFFVNQPRKFQQIRVTHSFLRLKNLRNVPAMTFCKKNLIGFYAYAELVHCLICSQFYIRKIHASESICILMI